MNLSAKTVAISLTAAVLLGVLPVSMIETQTGVHGFFVCESRRSLLHGRPLCNYKVP